MKFGKTIAMEFRKNWKGFLIFLLVVMVIAGLMAQLYPIVEEEFKEEEDELEREELVGLEFTDSHIFDLGRTEYEEHLEEGRVEELKERFGEEGYKVGEGAELLETEKGWVIQDEERKYRIEKHEEELRIYQETIYLDWSSWIEGMDNDMELGTVDFILDDINITYRVIEDTASHMATSHVVEKDISEENLVINQTENEDRYFAVIALANRDEIIDKIQEIDHIGEEVIQELLDEIFSDQEVIEITVGMNSTVEPRDPLEDLMDTPYFRMFTAGREDLRMDEIEGFMSVELYSWFILLVGLYLAYISVKSVGGDFDERRMDIIFSTPLPKKAYLLEKFLALSSFLFLLLLLSGIFTGLSVYSLGELNSVGMSTFVVSMLASWPMFLVIIAISMLFSVIFKSSRAAVGATFGVILVQYVFHMAGHMVEAIDFLRTFSIATYWDYNSVLLDGEFIVEDFFILLISAGLLLAVTLLIFEREDIPA